MTSVSSQGGGRFDEHSDTSPASCFDRAGLTAVTSRLRIIVSGLIAQYPLGGVTWDYLQYVVGLARLGHDVYYFEDTGQWPYNPLEDGLARDCEFNVGYLGNIMSRFGLGTKWAYRFPYKSQWFGLPDGERTEVIESADLLINVSCGLQPCSEYRKIRSLAFVDTDPVFTQVKLARGQSDFHRVIDWHDAHFSYGECFSDAVPPTGHHWRPMRKPILLSEWRPSTPRRNVFTTIMNWTSYKNVTYRGQAYGQKDVELMRFLELPSKVAPTVLEMAVGPGKTRRPPHDLLLRKGWTIVDPMKVCPDLDSYRAYIESSKAEWTVAKNGYVIGQAGWFSGRSACYLAAGRPVVVQDTGFGSVIPIGEGVLTFRTLDEAADAIREVEGNYDRQARAARAIAEEYFDSDKVLSRLLEAALNRTSQAADGDRQRNQNMVP